MHDFKYNHVQVPKHAMIINYRKNTTNMGSVNLAVLIVGETVDEYILLEYGGSFSNNREFFLM